MSNIYVTRKIPDIGIKLMREAGHDVDVNNADMILNKDELKSALLKKEYDAVLCLLTDIIDEEVFNVSPKTRIFANYAVGYNNIDIEVAQNRGITITNTPGVLTDTVAEYTVSLILSVVKRIPESDSFVRAGKYTGWAPELFLGSDIKGKTLGIIGAGRIGSKVAIKLKRGFEMNILYYDIEKNEHLEKEIDCIYVESIDELLKMSDIVSLHVPLLDSTHHLINKERLNLMKSTAYLINTSRGPVIDESALVDALNNEVIRGAGLDVFENEPELSEGLSDLQNVIITPHIGSASIETRNKMSEIAAKNIIDFLDGKSPENMVL